MEFDQGHLTLHEPLRDDDLEGLFDGAYDGMRFFDVRAGQLSEAGARRVGAWLAAQAGLHSLSYDTKDDERVVYALLDAAPRTLINLMFTADFGDGAGGLSWRMRQFPRAAGLSVHASGARPIRPAALVRALPPSHGLHLHSCNIDDDGMVELAADLHIVERLHFVSLLDNRIGAAGLEALARHLPETTIRKLELGMNPIDARALRLAAAAMAGPCALDSLDLKGVPLDQEGLRALLAWTSKMPALFSLSIDGSGLGRDSFPLLARLAINASWCVNVWGWESQPAPGDMDALACELATAQARGLLLIHADGWGDVWKSDWLPGRRPDEPIPAYGRRLRAAGRTVQEVALRDAKVKRAALAVACALNGFEPALVQRMAARPNLHG